MLKVQRQLPGHLSRPAAVARLEPFRHKTMPPRPLGHPEPLVEHVAIHDVAKRVAHRCRPVGPRQDLLRRNTGSLPGELVTYRFHVLHGLLQHGGDCRRSEVKPTYTRGLEYLLCCGAETFELLQQQGAQACWHLLRYGVATVAQAPLAVCFDQQALLQEVVEHMYSEQGIAVRAPVQHRPQRGGRRAVSPGAGPHTPAPALP